MKHRHIYPYTIEERIFLHCVHCGGPMQQYGRKTIDTDDHWLHLLVEPCECRMQNDESIKRGDV